MAGGMTILDQHTGDGFLAIHGDCVHALSDLPDASVGFSVYSPPFGDLFVYSDSAADMGNVSGDAQFFEQYCHVIRHMLRVLKPGRLTAVHCTDLPSRKGKDGFIGVKPFSDDIVRAHIEAGFIFHCRVTVWRDPVVEMQRTKALGLLYKQIKKDSCMSRTGLPDYLLVFRKPGDNPERVGHDEHEFPVDQWQQWASPVWMDIRQGNVLNVRMAREGEDERHLCPLQLDLIERAIRLWSNPGDVVLSPFMGIGSEGVTALKTGRKYVGVELKESYFRQAVKYLVDAEAQASVGTLFGAIA
ncbi:site-specific DNA-methyltransferase [Hyphomicrobium sp. CS1GBMeth3]|uniref:DNA-methyltransferase n=1 Tax=Hyphomicrobium sp. CS1GBMeth3 TaxID=1892845 RepID=UPI000AE15D7D|nr:site-specific DNA-methyltransferase [Hyphomicrobium sp. CS1GBMeth3]